MAKVVAELVVEGQRVFIRNMNEAEEAVEGMGRGADESSRKLSGMTSAMTALGGAVAAGALLRAGQDAANYAIQLGALEAKANIVFGGAVDQIRDFSDEHASRFGLAEDALTGLAAGYGDLLVPMGFQREEAADLTEQTLELAGALGEWSPQLGGAQHALEALGAAMTGEREQLKAYGIVIDEAAVQAELLARGQADLTGEAEKQAKAMATLDLALRGSADAQAAFAEGGDPAVVAAAEAKAAYEEVRKELGENLVPVMTTVNTVMANITGFFANLPEPVQTAGLALGGIAAAVVPIASVKRAVTDLGLSAGNLRTGLGNLRSFVIGPWGAAMLLGADALRKWAVEAEEARRLSDGFFELLRDNADLPDTEQLSRGDLQRQLLESEIAARGLREEMGSIGVTIDDVMQAINSDRFLRTDAVYGFGQELQDMFAGAFDFLPGVEQTALTQLNDLIGDSRSAMDEQTAAFEANERARLSNIHVTREYVDASYAAWGGMDAQANAAPGLASGHDSIAAAVEWHTSRQQALARETQVATQSLQDQMDTQRAAVDPVFAAASAQQGLADAQGRLAELQSSGQATAEEIAGAHQDLAVAALDYQGALTDLNDAQGTGATSQDQLREALELLEQQGLITLEQVDLLAGGYGRLSEQARDAATAMLEAAVQGGTAGYTDSFIRQAIGAGSGIVQAGSGGGVIEDLPGSAPLAAYTPVSSTSTSTISRSIQIGDIHVHTGGAADPVSVGRAARDGVLDAIATKLADEAAR